MNKAEFEQIKKRFNAEQKKEVERQLAGQSIFVSLPVKYFVEITIKSQNNLDTKWRQINYKKKCQKACCDIPYVKTGYEGKITVVYTRIIGSRGKVMDRANFAAGVKPVQDVLTSRGFWEDDTPEHIDDTYEQRKANPYEKPGLLIEISKG